MSFLGHFAGEMGKQMEKNQDEAREERKYQRRLADAKIALGEKREYDAELLKGNREYEQTQYTNRTEAKQQQWENNNAIAEKRHQENMSLKQQDLDLKKNTGKYQTGENGELYKIVNGKAELVTQDTDEELHGPTQDRSKTLFKQEGFKPLGSSKETSQQRVMREELTALSKNPAIDRSEADNKRIAVLQNALGVGSAGGSKSDDKTTTGSGKKLTNAEKLEKMKATGKYTPEQLNAFAKKYNLVEADKTPESIPEQTTNNTESSESNNQKVTINKTASLNKTNLSEKVMVGFVNEANKAYSYKPVAPIRQQTGKKVTYAGVEDARKMLNLLQRAIKYHVFPAGQNEESTKKKIAEIKATSKLQ